MPIQRIKPAELNEVSDRIELFRKQLSRSGSAITPKGKKFDIGMLSAVKSFQKKHHLKVTGKIDVPTAKKLAEYDRPVRKTAPKKPATRRT